MLLLMAAAMLNLSGRKFVVIPEKEYRELKAKAARNGKSPRTKQKLSKQDRGDIAESLRRLADPRRISHEQLKAELGL
jgi:uncharacterized protein YaiI (UPF0178 family)